MLIRLKIIVIFSYSMCNHFLDIVIIVLSHFDLLPFQVTVSGYNHKMRILLEKVIDKITNFKVEPDRFFVIKVSCHPWQHCFKSYCSSWYKDWRPDRLMVIAASNFMWIHWSCTKFTSMLYLGLLQILCLIVTFYSKDLGLLKICTTSSSLIRGTWTLLRTFSLYSQHLHQRVILGLLGANMSRTIPFAFLAGLPEIISHLIHFVVCFHIKETPRWSYINCISDLYDCSWIIEPLHGPASIAFNNFSVLSWQTI